MGILETIRAAVAGPGEPSVSTDPVDAGANSNRPAGANTEADMADNITAAGAVNPGIAEADHKAAVTKAETDGKAAGRKEANDRMAAVLGAEGVKGDGGRMAAALDLANQSPDMTAEAVVGFVTANVPANKPAAATDKAASYEQQRLAAAGLTQPSAGGDKPGTKSGLSAAVDRQIANMKRSA
jgi:hypothetical protein